MAKKSPNKKSNNRRKSPNKKSNNRRKSPNKKSNNRRKSPNKKSNNRRKSPNKKSNNRRKSRVRKSNRRKKTASLTGNYSSRFSNEITNNILDYANMNRFYMYGDLIPDPHVQLILNEYTSNPELNKSSRDIVFKKEILRVLKITDKNLFKQLNDRTFRIGLLIYLLNLQLRHYGNYIDIQYLDGNYFLVSSDEMTEIQIDGNDGFKIEFPGEKSVHLKEILFGNKTGHQVFGINNDIGNNFHIEIQNFNNSDILRRLAHMLFKFGRIENWDTSKVTDMCWLTSPQMWPNSNHQFNDDTLNFGKRYFNPDITRWNTSNVINMEGIFDDARFFNQNISMKEVTKNDEIIYMAWDINKVKNFNYAFNFNIRFNQNISNWQISRNAKIESMFSESNIAAENRPANLNINRYYISNPDIVE